MTDYVTTVSDVFKSSIYSIPSDTPLLSTYLSKSSKTLDSTFSVSPSSQLTRVLERSRLPTQIMLSLSEYSLYTMIARLLGLSILLAVVLAKTPFRRELRNKMKRRHEKMERKRQNSTKDAEA